MTPAADQSNTLRPRLLVLAGDSDPRAPLWSELRSSYDVAFASDEQALSSALSETEPALILLDDVELRDAVALRERVAPAGGRVPVAIMTSRGGEEEAVEALRLGFADYIVKRGENLRADLLGRRLGRTLELARLQRENERLHRAIEESQARLFSVYDSLDDVIMQIDDECRVHSLNRSAAALANIEPKDGVGKICWQLFDFYPCDKRAKKEQCHIYRTFLEGETIRGERHDEKTKQVTQYMTFITTLKESDYVVYRETDITEKRRLEEKIAAALRSLGASPDEGEGG